MSVVKLPDANLRSKFCELDGRGSELIVLELILYHPRSNGTSANEVILEILLYKSQSDTLTESDKFNVSTMM